MRVLVGKYTGEASRPIEYVVGGFQTHSDMFSLETPDFIEKGTYYAYIEIDWNNTILNEFGV